MNIKREVYMVNIQKRKKDIQVECYRVIKVDSSGIDIKQKQNKQQRDRISIFTHVPKFTDLTCFMSSVPRYLQKKNTF